MINWLTKLWEAGASGVQGAINMLVWAVVLVGAIVLIVLLMVIWTWWNTLPDTQKKLAKLLILAFVVIYALVTGWVFAPYLKQFGLPSTWDELLLAATDLWMRWDGWTRTHRWVGMVLLCLLPVLVWPRDSDNEELEELR